MIALMLTALVVVGLLLGLVIVAQVRDLFLTWELPQPDCQHNRRATDRRRR